MKTLVPLVLASGLVFPVLSGAQTPSSVGSAAVNEPKLQKVEQAVLDRTFTARDLIGKTVVNHEGERLGTINDVGLSETWSERFGGEAGDGTDAAEHPKEGDQLVYISTGGVLGLQGRLGLRADWVSVSADSLLYDRAQERFILNLPQNRFASIARGGPQTVATTSSDNGNGQGAIGGTRTSSAGGEEVTRIEEALRDDDDLRGARIQVSHTGSAIELRGEVDDAGLIRRAGDVAREQTKLEVRNLLEVSGAAE